MGAYLSRPKTEKDSAEGENADFEWGVCAMQGWRMDMEDAHAIELDLQSDGKPKASMFGVFDGHGGKEVARFTAMHIAKQLLGTQQFHQSQLKEALVETYLGLDEVMAQEETREQLRELAGGSSEKGADAEVESVQGDLPAELMEALKKQARSSYLGSEEDSDEEDPAFDPDVDDDAEQQASDINEEDAQSPRAGASSSPRRKSLGKRDSGEMDSPKLGSLGKRSSGELLQPGDGPEEQERKRARGEDGPSKHSRLNSSIASRKVKIRTEPLFNFSSSGSDARATSVADLMEQVTNSDPEANEEADDGTFPDDAEAGEAEDSSEGEGEEDPMITLKQMRQLNGGRQEYVGPMAGCTAVVALVDTASRKVVVANAGDSRCVVSRRGQAVDMSHDHKPTDPREESRINRAGCFVADGRINGSLNLSRALGDFEHKQAKDLPVAEQAVTAMPDVLELDLEDGIEFMILACDGIFDVLTNQEVIDFVRERLKAGESPKAICAQACDHCLAEDTEGCGKGCDNMSIMVVVFKQLANGYKNG